MKCSKEELLRSLASTLKLTGMGIDSLELKDKETAIIRYESGSIQTVNIACDSHIAIVKDVLSSITY